VRVLSATTAQLLASDGRAALTLAVRNGKGVEVVVEDSGQGTSADDRAGAFTPS